MLDEEHYDFAAQCDATHMPSTSWTISTRAIKRPRTSPLGGAMAGALPAIWTKSGRSRISGVTSLKAKGIRPMVRPRTAAGHSKTFASTQSHNVAPEHTGRSAQRTRRQTRFADERPQRAQFRHSISGMSGPMNHHQRRIRVHDRPRADHRWRLERREIKSTDLF